MKLSEKLKQLAPVFNTLRLKPSIWKEFKEAREVHNDMEVKVKGLISIAGL